MFTSGFFTAFRWRGVPIELHWTVFVGAVFVSGLRWAPGVWIGFFLLVLFHEMGHALLVWRARAAVVAIRMHGLGGECHFQGNVTPLSRSVIAWGGVLAQALLFALTLGILATPFAPQHPIAVEIMHVWLEPNLILILLNLLPIGPLDGAEAWKLFGRLRRTRPARRPTEPKREQPRAPERAVDEEHVAETVREALERAKREAREGRERQR